MALRCEWPTIWHTQCSTQSLGRVPAFRFGLWARSDHDSEKYIRFLVELQVLNQKVLLKYCILDAGLIVGWAAGVAYKESLGPKQKMNCDFNELTFH